MFKANELYLKAGELGDGNGYNILGINYENGNGVTKDLAKANEFYLKAGELGDGRGYNSLGVNYFEGLGVEKDIAKANEYFRKAAEMGNTNGMSNLGMNLLDGYGITKDITEAVAWLQKSADGGDKLGMWCFGKCYSSGRGVTKDLAKAAELFMKASEKNHAAATYDLGTCYELGLGIAKDEAKARELYEKAATLGDTRAVDKLKEFNLTPKKADNSNEQASRSDNIKSEIEGLENEMKTLREAASRLTRVDDSPIHRAVVVQDEHSVDKAAEPEAIEVAGLGLHLISLNNRVTASFVEPSGPAASVVRAGDQIISVNSKLLSTDSLEDCQKQLTGAPGDKLDLQLARYVRQALPSRVTILASVTCGPNFKMPNTRTEQGYRERLIGINRHYLLNTAYLEFGEDHYSLAERARQLLNLESSVPQNAAVDKNLRAVVKLAVQNDFRLANIVGVWPETQLQNLNEFKSLAIKSGIDLIRHQEVTVGDFAEIVLGAFEKSRQSHEAYSAYVTQRKANGGSEICEIFRERPQVISTAYGPYRGLSDPVLLLNPYLQFMRGFDAPTDRVNGYGLDQPEIEGRPDQQTPVSISSGMVRIKVDGMTGNRTHRVMMVNNYGAKYLFALVQTKKGVLGFRSTTGQTT